MEHSFVLLYNFSGFIPLCDITLLGFYLSELIENKNKYFIHCIVISLCKYCLVVGLKI